MAGMTAPPIVLLTDFGLSDAYVGMMRGVIAGINSDANVIDLTHGIGPQNIAHGAAVLADSCRYFPPGSIFVAVVDPGVGTDRAAILLETPDARFVAPDNGLLTLVCRQYEPAFGDTDIPGHAAVPDDCRAWRLTNPDYRRHPVSSTFHGRDVFAPVAAHLSPKLNHNYDPGGYGRQELYHGAANPEVMGEPIPSIAALALPIPQPWFNPNGATLRGRVIYADAFGNLITDITADILDSIGISPGNPDVTVAIAGHTITGLSRTFHDLPGSGLRALIGSHKRLEVAVVDGSAAATLGLGSGTALVITAGTSQRP